MPAKMTYRQFTKHMAEYLQVATGHPSVKQDGKGLIDDSYRPSTKEW
jgi:hypothetical protein